MLLALSSTQELVLGLAAAAFVTFALVSSMVIPRSHPDYPGRHIGWFLAAAVVFTVGMLAAVVFVARETAEEEAVASETHTVPTTTVPTNPGTSETTETTSTTTEAPKGNAAAGKKIFTSAGCVSCHTLSDAKSSGTVGPNLDDAAPPYDKVVERVTNGKAPMPSFAGTLTPEQIQDVAAYVSSVTGP